MTNMSDDLFYYAKKNQSLKLKKLLKNSKDIIDILDEDSDLIGITIAHDCLESLQVLLKYFEKKQLTNFEENSYQYKFAVKKMYNIMAENIDGYGKSQAVKDIFENFKEIHSIYNDESDLESLSDSEHNFGSSDFEYSIKKDDVYKNTLCLRTDYKDKLNSEILKIGVLLASAHFANYPAANICQTSTIACMAGVLTLMKTIKDTHNLDSIEYNKNLVINENYKIQNTSDVNNLKTYHVVDDLFIDNIHNQNIELINNANILEYNEFIT